jgi:hypothetical protein
VLTFVLRIRFHLYLCSSSQFCSLSPAWHFPHVLQVRLAGLGP